MEGFFTKDRLINGPWQAFERAIARHLLHAGWDLAEIVGGTGDMGADVIASRNGKDVIIQSKFSSINKTLSINVVDEVKNAMQFYDIDQGIIMSNRGLSSGQKARMKELNRPEQGFKISRMTGQSIINSFNKLPMWTNDKRRPRDYQQKALDRLSESVEKGSSKGLITLATGLGKTFVAGNFIKWYIKKYSSDCKILILANTQNLIEQFDREIWSFLPKTVMTHLLYQNEKPINHKGVILSTFQSLPDYIDKNPSLTFDLVIIDEAHHAPAETYSAIINKLKPKYLLGLTATPFRKDKKSVTNIFGEPLIKYDVVRAINNGLLSKVKYIIKNDNIDTDWITMNSNHGYTIKELNKKVFIKQLDEEIVDSFLQEWNKKKPEKGIIFCNSSEHCERVETMLRNAGYSCASLTTRIKDKKERMKRLRSFRLGNIKMLTCYDMLNEGIDVPDVDFIVFLRVTHSRVNYLQQLGRGLRKKEGKELLVLDYVGDIRRIKHVRRFKKDYDEYKPKSVEELVLPENFGLKISNEPTLEFLDLVKKDDIEHLDELDENDNVFIH